MRLLLIFLLAFGSFCGFAQQVGDYYGVLPYHYTVNYPDHNSSFYVQPGSKTLKHTDPGLSYYWYSGRQVNVTHGGFSGKLLHGKYVDYYLNKNLKEQGVFKMGLKDGEWKSWNPEGKLISIYNYDDGMLDGAFQTYAESGNVASSGLYKKGQLHGKQLQYGTDGKVEITRYKNGVVQNPKPQKSFAWIKRFFKKS